MKALVGNIISLLSALGIVLVTLILGGMIFMFGIGVLKGLEDAMLLFALWDFSCLYITLCGGYAWICYGVDKWIELDHKLQLKLLGKIY